MRHATFSPLRLGGCPILRPRRRVVVLRRRCNSGARAADRSLVLQPAGRCAVVPPAAVQGSISARPTRHVSPTTPWSTPTEWRGRPVNRAKDPRKPDSLHMLAGALATFTQIENDCSKNEVPDEGKKLSLANRTLNSSSSCSSLPSYCSWVKGVGGGKEKRSSEKSEHHSITAVEEEERGGETDMHRGGETGRMD